MVTVCLLLLEALRYHCGVKSPTGMLLVLLQIGITQALAVLTSSRRYARALFTGLTASNYTLAGTVVGAIAHIITHNILVGVGVSVAIHIFLLWFFMKYIRDKYFELQERPSKTWYTLCGFPVLFYLCAYTCISWPVSIYREPLRGIPAVLILVTMVMSYAVLIKLYHTRQSKAAILKSNAILRSYSEMLEREQSSMEEIRRELSIQKHDYQHQLRYLLTLCGNQDTEKQKQAIEELLEEVESIQVTHEYCKNDAVNRVLTYMAAEAKKNGIELKTQLDIPQLLKASNVGLAIAVSNLLGNAVNACKELQPTEARWIRVYAKRTEEHLILEISNTCDPTGITFNEETGLPVTTHGEEHGIGMQSIRAFAEKHEATFDCEVRGNVFYARLLLQ